MHCPYNQRMICKWFPCPFENESFNGMLTAWVICDREPVSLNWSRGGEPDPQAAERKTLRKCEVTRLFEFPERVQMMLAFGGMTKWICDDLRRGLYLWNETRDGISLRRAKQRWHDKGGNNYVLIP